MIEGKGGVCEKLSHLREGDQVKLYLDHSNVLEITLISVNTKFKYVLGTNCHGQLTKVLCENIKYFELM